MFHNRLTAVLLLSTSGILAACAVPPDNVITRASQVNEALSNFDNECQYSGITNSLTEQIRAREDAEDVLKRLSDVCPDLEIGFAEGVGTEAAITSAAIGGSFSDPDGSDFSRTKGGTESGSGGAGSGAGGIGGGGSGTQSSGGGGTGGGNSGAGGSGGGGGGGSDDSGSQGLGGAQSGLGGGDGGSGGQSE